MLKRTFASLSAYLCADRVGWTGRLSRCLACGRMKRLLDIDGRAMIEDDEEDEEEAYIGFDFVVVVPAVDMAVVVGL